MSELTTVRIMAINVTKHEAREILVVSTLEGTEDSMKRIRIYLKEDFWNYEHLEIATMFYTKLVKERLLLRKKVLNKHLLKTYQEITDLKRNKTLLFSGIERLYIKNVKSPMSILRKPRKGYKEVKSDTLRLWYRDKAIEEQKQKYKELKGE